MIYLAGFLVTFIILTYYVNRVLGNDIDGASLISILLISSMSWGALVLVAAIYIVLNFKSLVRKYNSKVIIRGKRK